VADWVNGMKVAIAQGDEGNHTEIEVAVNVG